nr:RNA-directed DNA polymerase, eukaryota [Tanacetum cinerariifolium]
MRDANPIRTIGDYSKSSHEGYMDTIKLPVGNNVVPLRSDTIWIHHHMGGSYYSFPCSVLSTGKDYKTPQRYPDVQQHQGKSLLKQGIIEEESLRTLDSSTTVFACVKEFRALTNMRSICYSKGFTDIKLRYLRVLWISVESQTMVTCEKFKKHEGINSWFSSIRKPSVDFFIPERVAWIDVEGVPSQAWTHQAFTKIASKWGQLIYTVYSSGTNMYSARLWINTFVDSLIYETFKINVRGHVLSVRSKEITGWVLEFLEDTSKVESEGKGEMEMSMDSDPHEEYVEDSFCNSNDLSSCMKDASSDLFGLDELIHRTTKNNKVSDLNEPKFPPGFTPVEACNDSNAAKEHLSTTQVDGYKEKNKWIRGLCIDHNVNFLSIQETKKATLSSIAIRNLWGNSYFDFSRASTVSQSGGNLCIWDKGVFIKSREVINTNFVALEGVWVSSKTSILLVVVYAPQDFNDKKTLWTRLLHLINDWNGKATLTDIPFGGYMYTWSDREASKMSKIDRFLVSEGLLSIFPHISSVILTRHLSDHRPLLLNESVNEYGPTPFRLFHSWFLDPDFAKVVEKSWTNDGLSDSNGIIRLKNKLKALKNRLKMWNKNKLEEHVKLLLENFENLALLVPGLLSLTFDGFVFDLWAEIVPELDSLINRASLLNYLMKNCFLIRLCLVKPPKRTSTFEASVMTHAAIRKLVVDSVAIALEAQATMMARAVGLIRWFKRTESPIGVKEAYKITWSEFKRLLIKKYCPQTKIKKMEEAITMTQKLIEEVLKHNSIQETNNHKGKLEDRRNTTNDVTPLFIKKTLCHNLGVISKHS